MTHRYRLFRRSARLRAPLLVALAVAITACDEGSTLDPHSSTTIDLAGETPISSDPISSIEEDTPYGEDEPLSTLAPVDAPTLASASYAGGIPIGTTAQPTSQYGATYNGALRTIWPQYLNRELGAIKSRGGKVVLMFAGNEQYYKDADGHFSLSKWKARIDRFRNVNFSSYINDGTVVAHYLIDEPNDPANWNGKPVPPSVVEEMAAYSKQIWPAMLTVARTDPSYLASNHRHLDAAWAQYVHRRGSASDYIRRVVSDAQNKGLGLVVGLNVLKGGVNGSRMTAAQVKEWGTTLLSSSYPCAFISWKYNDDYLSSSGMRDAMAALRNRAESRSAKTCKG